MSDADLQLALFLMCVLSALFDRDGKPCSKHAHTTQTRTHEVYTANQASRYDRLSPKFVAQQTVFALTSIALSLPPIEVLVNSECNDFCLTGLQPVGIEV